MKTTAIRAAIPLLRQKPPVHYLDNAATSLMPQNVIDATTDYDSRIRANVGRGVYAWAEQATIEYENSRRIIADSLSALPNEIVFCGGATAAINLLAASICNTIKKNESVWLATDNHHSNIVPWQIAAAKHGFALHQLPSKKSGTPDLSAVAKALATAKQPPKVLAVTHVSNVSGAILDIAKLAKIARKFGALLLVDGAQYVPHEFPNVQQLNADFYVFSGHKCYAPNGIGVLWGRKDLLDSLSPTSGGGGMIESVDEHNFTYRAAPHKWEAGTPPISQAIALAAAAKWRQQWNEKNIKEEMGTLANRLREELKKMPVRLLSVNHGMPIVSFYTPQVHPHDICQILAAHHVAARGGHHCAQPLMRKWNINGCVRLSLAPYNTAADVTAALAAIDEAIKILR